MKYVYTPFTAHSFSYALPEMWTASVILLNITTHAQNQLQAGLLTQYHIFPQNSSKLRPIMTTERLSANMWSVRTADTD